MRLEIYIVYTHLINGFTSLMKKGWGPVNDSSLQGALMKKTTP